MPADANAVAAVTAASKTGDALAPPSLRIEHIRLRRDFLAANSGIRVVTPAFILLVKRTGEGIPRVGFTVSRKVGNSVARNRARRRLREVARASMADASLGSCDYIYIGRAQPSETPYEKLLSDARYALVKAARKLEAAD